MELPVHLIVHGSGLFIMIGLLLTGILTARLRKKPGWMKSHRVFVLSGVLSGIIGISAMFIFKAVKSYPHFSSSHSRTGLSSLVFLLIAPVLGGLLIKGKEVLRFPHKIAGRVGFLIGLIALVFGIMKVLS